MEGTVMLIEKFDEVEALDQAIADLLARINDGSHETKEYAEMADNLTKLIKNKQIIAELKLKSFDANVKVSQFAQTLTQKDEEIRLKEEDLKLRDRDMTNQDILKGRELDLKQSEADKPDRVSKETLAVIGANIAGIVMILGYERANVIASKAFSLIMRR